MTREEEEGPRPAETEPTRAFVVISRPAETEPTRAFVVISRPGDDEYVPIATVLVDVERAKRELEAEEIDRIGQSP